MNTVRTATARRLILLLWLIAGFLSPAFSQASKQEVPTFTSALVELLPGGDAWQASEHPHQYLPETLFEYINGAAESYIGYDFKELLVAQYTKKGAPAGSLTLEIYDMGNSRNAFGIYGAERYPESLFIPVGAQGYYEDGSLNFLAGRYYIKLMCFDCGTDAEQLLTSVSRDIAGRVRDQPGFPPPLAAFPGQGLVAHSEKFILRNFQGLSFLGNGFQAGYRLQGFEFECFIVESRDEAQAEAAALQYLDHYRSVGATIQANADGWEFRDKYLLNVFAARRGRYLFGVSRIPDGRLDTGRAYLGMLAKSLRGATQPSDGGPEQ
jgi:hypothetical protein